LVSATFATGLWRSAIRHCPHLEKLLLLQLSALKNNGLPVSSEMITCSTVLPRCFRNAPQAMARSDAATYDKVLARNVTVK